MKTISDLDLEHVIGGKTPPVTTSLPGSSYNNNSALMSSLYGIQNSLKDLGRNQNQGFCGNNGLLFMGMALAMSRRNDVYVHGSYSYRGPGFRWRAYW
jgi:hypothetical protein